MSQRIAVVVAGGSGMGAAAARKLAQDGFKIAILSSSGKARPWAKNSVASASPDRTSPTDDLTRLVGLTMERWGRIDVFVNSAGHGPRAPCWNSPTSNGTRASTSIC